ncbi:MAG: hypothetical protein IT449_04905 [Phycisphaerales bacterium]|nr:hypothetical protein [Phycisphaerales bacterium]
MIASLKTFDVRQMDRPRSEFRGLMVVHMLLCATWTAAFAQEPKPAQPPAKEDPKPAADAPADQKGMKPIDLKLPRPQFKGTPKNAPPGSNLEPPRKGPRPAFLAPEGTTNLAKGKPALASDKDPIIGETKFVTDGEKEANEGTYVEYGPGVQWVQLDLGKPQAIYAIVFWHFHQSARIYHDVIVQVADDKDFVTHVRTLFNNDHDNSAGLGLGTDKEYWETYEGKLVDAKGEKARFVRLLSNGSIADDQNHYIEVEIWAKD